MLLVLEVRADKGSFNGSSVEVVGGLSSNNGNYSVRYTFLILSLAFIRWLTSPVSMAVLPSYTTVHITPTRLKCHVSPACRTALIEVFIATSLVDETHSITMTNLEADKQFGFDYLVSNSTSDPSKPDLAGIAISDPVDVGGVSPSDPIVDGPSNIALIGGIIGGIVGISLLALLCLILWKRQKKAKKVVLGTRSTDTIGEIPVLHHSRSTWSAKKSVHSRVGCIPIKIVHGITRALHFPVPRNQHSRSTRTYPEYLDLPRHQAVPSY